MTTPKKVSIKHTASRALGFASSQVNRLFNQISRNHAFANAIGNAFGNRNVLQTRALLTAVGVRPINVSYSRDSLRLVFRRGNFRIEVDWIMGFGSPFVGLNTPAIVGLTRILIQFTRKSARDNNFNQRLINATTSLQFQKVFNSEGFQRLQAGLNLPISPPTITDFFVTTVGFKQNGRNATGLLFVRITRISNTTSKIKKTRDLTRKKK